jgi:hypothetical protein
MQTIRIQRQGKITEVKIVCACQDSSDGRAGAALLVYGMYHSFILTAIVGWHGVGHGIKCKDKEKWLLPKLYNCNKCVLQLCFFLQLYILFHSCAIFFAVVLIYHIVLTNPNRF